jgi:hypothetical protein
VYLYAAVEKIDDQLGKGYAAKHPELIAAFMQTCVADFMCASILMASQHIGDELSDGLGTIANALEESRS